MIESVHGAMTFAMPTAISIITTMMCNVLLFGSNVEKRTNDIATIVRPAATTSLLPKRRTHTGESGARIIIVTACGMSTAPAFTVE